MRKNIFVFGFLFFIFLYFCFFSLIKCEGEMCECNESKNYTNVFDISCCLATESVKVGASFNTNFSSNASNDDNYNNLSKKILKIYMNNRTESPHRIFTNKTSVVGIKFEKGIQKEDKNSIKDNKITKETITKSVDDFISKNKYLLKVNPEELRQVNFDSDGENYYLNYQQHYKRIPVYKGYVGLTINKEGKILLIGSDFYQIKNASIIPKISKDDAIDLVKREINFNAAEDKLISISPLILPDNEEYLLVWQINVFTKHPLSNFVFFVDANNGNVIQKENTLRSVTINGTVSGMIYPKRYDDEKINANFSYEKVRTNISFQSKAFYSGYGTEGNFYDSDIETKLPISLPYASLINLSFIADYDIESGWDFAYVEISDDLGNTWYQLNGSYTTDYYNPMVLAKGWINNSQAYTGDSNGVIYEEINISKYAGENILLRFRYTTDKYLFKKGFYVDNITINAEGNIIFFDDCEDDNKWSLHNFNITDASFETSNAITDKNGYYEINVPEDVSNLTIRSELKGLYADVDNEDEEDAEHNYNLTCSANMTHNWNWNESDNSYKKVESNVYYHVNKIHDYFKKFNFNKMDYPLTAVVNYGTNVCNAYHSPGEDRLIFYEGKSGCENLGLGSDIIYHEYSHAVVHHIYDLEPYSGESGALDEALADYFAATVNDDPVIADGWNFNRTLNNTLTMDNWITELFSKKVHENGQIMSGALWKLREEFNATLADSLTFEAIRVVPHPYNFSEFLENLLIADDDNANLADGTPNKEKICSIFGERKIYSSWCSNLPDLTVKNLTYAFLSVNDTNYTITVNVIIKNERNKNLNLSNVNVSLLVDGIYACSKILNLTNVTEKEVNFNLSAILGKHNITSKVDPENLTDEFDEHNNELTKVIGVGCTIPADDFYVNENTFFCKEIYGNVRVTINTSNVVLDCNNATLNGSFSDYGIKSINENNVTIRNCNIINYGIGIWLQYSSSNTLINNTANSNTYYGIFLYYSSNNTISNNTESNNRYYGISLSHSSENTLINNAANGNGYGGIWLYYSPNNVLTNSTTNDNGIDGIFLYSSSSNTLTNSTANDNDDAGIYSSGSTNNTLTDSTASNNDYGIYISSSSDNTLINSTLNNNTYGIYLRDSANNTLVNNTAKENDEFDIYLSAFSDEHCNNFIENNIGSGDRAIKYFNYAKNLENENLSELILCNADNSSINNVTIDGSDALKNNGVLVIRTDNSNFTNINSSNNYYGIYLNFSQNNALTNNTANSNDYYGIYLSHSSKNALINNTANLNSAGIWLYSSSNNNTLTNNTANSNNYYGIYLSYSSNNALTNNTANSNTDGVRLFFSTSNTLTNNTANDNTDGIYLSSSSNNTLANNIMNNNIYNFGIYGLNISHFYQNIDISNKVDNKQIYYWTNEKNAQNNCKNLEIDESSNAGFVALISCDNITVRNLNLRSNSHGILLVNTTNSKILSNTANLNYEGIFLFLSSNNILTNNSACENAFIDFYTYNYINTSTNTGENNTCESATYWNDTGATGCTFSCCKKFDFDGDKNTDIFDAVTALEYLNGERNESEIFNKKCSCNGNLEFSDVLNLMERVM